jgi:ankyrin repeat protein
LRAVGLVAAVTIMVLAACSGTPGAQQSPTQPDAPDANPTTVLTPPPQSPSPTPTPAEPTPIRDPAQDPILIAAARGGDLSGVRQALATGASVHATDETGQTALIAAAYGNHVEVAATLIDAGADVNAKDQTQQSAYLIATSEVGDDPRLLQLTLAHGADVTSLDSYNGTGLIRAGERGFPNITALLLTTGIEVNHVNRSGWIALHEAIIYSTGGQSHVDTVRLLIDGGSDVDLPGQSTGQSPLQMAQDTGDQRMVDLLLRAGAS